MDYDAYLDRAMEEVPEIAGSDERLDLPDPRAERDGAFTRLTNLGELADALSRDPDHMHRFIQRDLGTSGKLGEGRARYSGNFSSADFSTAIDRYVVEYVTCSECGLPDTRLVRENRTPMLRCDACGAFRPVSKRRRASANQHDRAAVEEGRTYEVKITGTGRKGDGVAQRGEYTIFVPGAAEGDEVTVFINNVSGNLAFARIAER